jgi:phage terminase small subunit
MPDAANAIWDALARALAAAGRLEPEDGVALESLVRAVAMRDRIWKELDAGAIVVTLANHTTAPNQHFKALAQIEAQIERGVRHFGLSPATRGALKADRPGAESEEFDDFLGTDGD